MVSLGRHWICLDAKRTHTPGCTSPAPAPLPDLASRRLTSTCLHSTCLGLPVFQESGVLSKFSIAPETLANFLAAIGSRYHANPYHNFNHGVHVLLASWLLAREEFGRSRAESAKSGQRETQLLSLRVSESMRDSHQVEPLSDMHVLALLVAAIGHDLDHPGLNNAFLVNSSSPLALRYNDQSVLENHHAATTFAVLGDPKCNVLAGLSDEQRKEARKLIISTILCVCPRLDTAHVRCARAAWMSTWWPSVRPFGHPLVAEHHLCPSG